MKSGTRGDFFQSINQIDQEAYPGILNSFFEQFSILYNIIGGYENLQVSKSADQFTFDIVTPSPEIADDIMSRINGEVVQVYDKTFSISGIRTGSNGLNIQIR